MSQAHVSPAHLQISASIADSSSSKSLCSCWTEGGSRACVLTSVSCGCDSGGQALSSFRASCSATDVAVDWAADLAASCRNRSPLPGCQYAGVASTCFGYSLLMQQFVSAGLRADMYLHRALCPSGMHAACTMTSQIIRLLKHTGWRTVIEHRGHHSENVHV